MPIDRWLKMASLHPADAVRTAHCRGCKHLKALDNYGFDAYCGYLDDTGHRRPCKFGTDPCLGKELEEGYQMPSEQSHWETVQQLESVVRKKTVNQIKRKKRRGRKTTWDSEYAAMLYLTGEYYLFEIAEIVGCQQKQISNFAFNHMWTMDRHEQLAKVAKVRHNIEEEKAKYEAWKTEKTKQKG